MTRSMTDGMDRLPGGSPMQLKRVTREARNMCDASRGVVASESIGRRAFAPFPPSLVSILMGIFRIQLLLLESPMPLEFPVPPPLPKYSFRRSGLGFTPVAIRLERSASMDSSSIRCC